MANQANAVEFHTWMTLYIKVGKYFHTGETAWFFDEAEAKYQVDDWTVSSISKFMIWAEEDDVALPTVALDMLETEASIAALNREDGTWRVVLDVNPGLEVVAAVALVISFVIFMYDWWSDGQFWPWPQPIASGVGSFQSFKEKILLLLSLESLLCMYRS
jgi:hypothetical protein